MRDGRGRRRYEEPIQLDGEQWKDFPGKLGYEVSNLGRVRAKPRILVGSTDPRGYKTVAFYPNGKAGGPKRLPVHRAVATAFHGPGTPGLEVAHLNGNPSDNRAENLAWATPKENASHRFNHGTQPFGERSYQVKLTAEQALQIRQRGRAGESATRLGREFGITRESARDIVKGKNWKQLAE